MKFLFFGILLVCSSCQNKYEKLDLMSMKEVMEIKQAEKGEQKKIDDDPEPSMPDMKKNEETVAGIDADNDGIRDDVEIWINRNFKTANERRAFKQYANVQMQWIIKKQNGGTDEDMRNMHQPLRDAMGCNSFVTKTFGDIKFNEMRTIEELLRQLVIDTELRARVSIQADIASRGGGATSELAFYDEYKLCNFKVDSLDDLVKFWKSVYKQ
jgi:hypothetical protein